MTPPAGSVVLEWLPFSTPDEMHVGWCGRLADGGRIFEYMGPDPDHPDHIVRYRGPYGFPNADEVVS